MTEPRGRIYFVARAPVDITYEHTIDFKDANEQNAFWRSLSKFEMMNYSYVRRDRASLTIDKPYEALDGINYLFFQSRDNSKWYYAFVIDRKYISDDATTVFFEIDVMQTFMFDYAFKPSYIIQSHVDRWNADHKPIYSYTDEGLDYGSEYLTEAAFRIKPGGNYEHGFYLIFCTNHSELIDSGDASEPSLAPITPTPYCIYLVHDKEEPVRVLKEQNESDMTFETFPAAGIKDLFTFMANSNFGDYVHQIIYVPYLPYKYSIIKSGDGTYDYSFIDEAGSQTFAHTKLKVVKTNIEGGELISTRTLDLIKINNVGDKLSTFIKDLASMPIYNGIEEHVPTAAMWSDLKNAPYTTKRDRRFESKLLCYPYRYNIFTDWKSNPVIIKNEYLTGDNITVAQVFSYGFNLNRRYYVKNYRGDLEGREASIHDNLPIESPVFSDAYYQYMLQNRNQIAANFTNARLGAVQQIGSAGISALKSTAAGASSGGGWGALVGGMIGMSELAMTTVNAAVNYQSLIRSEGAKQKDISALPDIFTETSDPIMARLDKTSYLHFYRKGICCNFAEQIAQYWHMYGYIVRRVEIPNLRSRLRYNYIRTIGANLTGNVESGYLAAIKSIYNNGITIWHYSAENFNPIDYTYENPERKLL